MPSLPAELWQRLEDTAVRRDTTVEALLETWLDQPSVSTSDESTLGDLAKPLFDAVYDALFILDEEWRFTYLNEEAHRLMGEEDLHGRVIWQAFPDSVGSSFYWQYQHARRENRPVSFTEYYSPLETWYEVRVFPINEQLIICFRDVSKYISLQNSLDQLRHTITQLQDELVARKQLQQTIDYNGHLLTNIVEIAADAIILIDEEMRILRFNQGAEKIFGYQAEEVIGQSINILLPHHLRERHTAHIQRFGHSDKKSRLMANERGTVPGLRKDGTQFPARASISRLKRKGSIIYTVILQDATTEQTAIETRRRLVSILEATTDLVGIMNTSQEIVYLNKAAKSFFGLDDDTENIALTNILSAESTAQLLQEALPTAWQEGSWEGEMPLMNQAGDVLPTSMVIMRHLNSEGEATHLSAIVRDLTKRYQLEEDLRRSLREAQELSQLKSQFVETLSHEFRTPLARIRLTAELLKRQNHNQAQEKHFEHIIEHVNLMTELITDGLSYVQLVPDTAVYQQVSLGELGEQAIVAQQELHPGRVIELTTPDTAVLVRVPINLTLKIMHYLLDNALSYSPADEPVRLLLDATDEQLCIRVADKGVGIPPEDQPHIFESFYRGQNVAHTSGIGLGLTLVREMVTQLQGEISLSQNGEGTTFTVYLPSKSV